MRVDVGPGGAVYGARIRAGLSVDEVAQRVGVEPALLQGVEAGQVDPPWSLVQAVVHACGQELIVGTKFSQSEADLEYAERLVNAITRLLLRTAPREKYPLDLATSWHFPLVGLHIVNWQLLHAACLAYELGHGGAVLPLVARTIFENTVTAHWIAESPDDRVRRFIESGTRDAEQRQELDPQIWAERQERWRAAFGDPEGKFSGLPPVRERLREPFGEHYDRYRSLSAVAHPSLDSIYSALYTTGAEVMTHERDSSSGAVLAFAACHLWFLALELETLTPDIDVPDAPEGRTGLGFNGSLDEFIALGQFLISYTTAEGPLANTPDVTAP